MDNFHSTALKMVSFDREKVDGIGNSQNGLSFCSMSNSGWPTGSTLGGLGAAWWKWKWKKKNGIGVLTGCPKVLAQLWSKYIKLVKYCKIIDDEYIKVKIYMWKP